jgi:hypothetical protein
MTCIDTAIRFSLIYLLMLEGLLITVFLGLLVQKPPSEGTMGIQILIPKPLSEGLLITIFLDLLSIVVL